MKKKTKIIIISVLAVILIALIGYKLIGGAIISNKTKEYLKTKECFSKHINSVKVRNSLFNKFMSYDEWNITVNLYGSHEFTFTYRDKKIVLTGVAGDQKTLPSKEDYTKLMQKLESGEFCNPKPDSQTKEVIDKAFNYMPQQYKGRVINKYNASVTSENLNPAQGFIALDINGNEITVSGNIILITFSLSQINPGIMTSDNYYGVALDITTHELIGFPIRL